MRKFTLYHNPACSKSRQALDILLKQGINPTIIDYIKTPLSFEQLLELRSHFDLNEFVRTNEPAFKLLRLTLKDETTVLKAILKEPILMQRPIIICDGKAIIARPPEKILDLLK